jgi:ribosome-binding factor A
MSDESPSPEPLFPLHRIVEAILFASQKPVSAKELSAIFQQDTKSMFGASFITVSGVNVSPDLGIATVYLSLTLTKKPQLILEEIREKGKQIRSLLAGKIRHQVRIIPELRFFADETLLEAERMDKLLASLNIPPAAPEETEES